MGLPTTAAGLAAILVASLLAPVPTSASTTLGIQRCVDGYGNPVYTDKACTAVGAQQADLSDAMIDAIVREELAQRQASLPPEHRRLPAQRRAPGDGCARSPQQLAGDLAGSMAQDDVNRVAESFHWSGMSQRQGRARLESLRSLTGRQVMGGRYFGGAGDAGRQSVGRMHLLVAAAGGARALQLDVHRQRGCYFASL